MTLPYQHKDITRLKAEEHLLRSGKDGSYLIRNSESVQGAYTLCVLYQEKVHQYRILTNKDGKLRLESGSGANERLYSDLGQLMHGFVNKRENYNRLVCSLVYPIETEQAEQAESDDSDDDDLEMPPNLEEENSLTSEREDDTKDDSYIELEYSEIKHRAMAETPRKTETTDHEESKSCSISEGVKNHYRDKFSSLDLSSVEGGFITALEDYISRDICVDVDHVQKGVPPTKMHQLLGEQAAQIRRQLESFMCKVDVLKDLFGDESEPITIDQDGDDYQVLQRLLDKTKVDLAILNDQASSKLRTLTTYFMSSHMSKLKQSAPLESTLPLLARPTKKDTIKPFNFEVIPASSGNINCVKTAFKQKQTLTVELKKGILLMVKHSKDVLDDTNVFHHNKILQLIKSTSSATKLDILIEGKKKRNL